MTPTPPGEDDAIEIFSSGYGDPATGFARLGASHVTIPGGVPWERDVRRSRFSRAIDHHLEAVSAYRDVVAANGDSASGDEVLEASASVHESLRGIEVMHVIYTGASFPGSSAGTPSWFGDDAVRDDVRPDAESSPIADELPAVLGTNLVLRRTDGDVLRLRELRVHSDGFVLVVERLHRRTRGDWQQWEVDAAEALASAAPVTRADFSPHQPPRTGVHLRTTTEHDRGYVLLVSEHWHQGSPDVDLLECSVQEAGREAIAFTLESAAIETARPLVVGAG